MPSSPVVSLLRSNGVSCGGPVGDSVSESDHRIANNLALVAGLLRLEAASVEGAGRPLNRAEISGLLLEAAGRVETVGRLHRRLARGEGDVALGSLIREVVDDTVASLASSDQVRLGLSLAQAPPSLARLALPVALAVAELVTNSIKYAHPAGGPARIDVRASLERDGAYLVEVADDGVGLPEGFDPTTSTGLGLTLVRALAHQIGATLAFADTGVGLIVSLRVPAQAGPSDGASK